MKNYILPLLILSLSIMSCQKEDDILTPISPNPTNIETNNIVDTTIVLTNNDTVIVSVDTLTNNTTTTYKLVKCTYEYIDNDDQSNNISYFGYPYNEYGTTADFSDDGFYIDTILVNMPMYPTQYTIQSTLPLYFNGEPEWFQLTVNSISEINETESYVDVNADMKRVICSQIIHDLEFRFFISEHNGTITLHLSDIGDNWRSNQTMCFEPM
tara:strand:- start:2861 stop:3496 length:636 start_codon:yes stop_codon:yes gene_type:complete